MNRGMFVPPLRRPAPVPRKSSAADPAVVAYIKARVAVVFAEATSKFRKTAPSLPRPGAFKHADLTNLATAEKVDRAARAYAAGTKTAYWASVRILMGEATR